MTPTRLRPSRDTLALIDETVAKARTEFDDPEIDRQRVLELLLEHRIETLKRTSSDLTLIPVLEGELARDPERDRKRLEEFRAARAGDAAGHRLAYFEGHLLQREGKHAEAVKKFRLGLASDASLPQPYLRVAESLRADGRVPEAESMLREALKERFAGSADLWNLWLDISATGMLL